MKTIINVGNSLITMMQWDVVRFDIQAYSVLGGKITGYVGYIKTSSDIEVRIHDNGTFEYVED